ncbi:MAG: NADH-quinone oxidoreductase subunit C [Planctomycetes bacterium]|nr:NADH-quinone oxidoreductase subunit C [Planctomycetota bacterium]
MSALREELESLAAGLGEGVRPTPDRCGEIAFAVDRAALVGFVTLLLEHADFRMLVLVTAVDNYLDEPRFGVVYQLRSLGRNADVRLDVAVPGEDPEVASLCDLYPAANWMEREVWDMFGVRFTGHPNLERILMWEGFEGHPLRKDYPLLGNTPGTPGHLGKGGKA